MKQFAWLCLAMLVSLAACRDHPNQAGLEKERVVLAVGGKTAITYLPLTIAEQQEFFKAEGLEVEIQDLQGGAKALQAMVGGSADVVLGYYDHTIQMQAKGQELTAVVCLNRYPGLVLGVRSELAFQVKQVSDLKGMKIGVTAPGSSSHFFLNYLLSQQGLKPADISAIGIGASYTAVAAVEQKQVDALVSLDPMITALDSRGLIKILADTRAEKDTRAIYGDEHPGAALYTTREFIERYPRTTQRLVNALVKALRGIQSKSPEEVTRQLPESSFAGNKELYLKGLANSLPAFSPDGRFTEAGPRKALEVLALFDEQVARASIDLSKTYTNRFVDQAPR
jgi:NitT/TauT family transport system substrate-binding protein